MLTADGLKVLHAMMATYELNATYDNEGLEFAGLIAANTLDINNTDKQAFLNLRYDWIQEILELVRNTALNDAEYQDVRTEFELFFSAVQDSDEITPDMVAYAVELSKVSGYGYLYE